MRDDEIALLIPIIAVTGPFVVIAFNIIAKSLTRVICHWRDVSLKIRLVEAGMSPDEIERIVMATSDFEKNKGQAAGVSHGQMANDGKPPARFDVREKPIHSA